MDNGVWVQIRNFQKLLGRSDIKIRAWFLCANDLLEDEDFFDFDPVEICVWIYILGQCSKKKSDKVFINFERAERFARLKKKDVLSAIEKLSRNQLVPMVSTDDVQPAYTSCTDGVQVSAPTGEDRGGQGNGIDGLPAIARTWNELVRKPKIKKWGKDRDRLVGQVDPEEWAEACEKIAASDFLSGRAGKKWRATFDWLLNPKNLRKVIEGNYDENEPENESQICGVANF